MTEEAVTTKIISWLEARGWTILAYDFPQSGTGKTFRPNAVTPGCKTSGNFIPDIVAYRGGVVIIMENKPRLDSSDFHKLDNINKGQTHSMAITEFLDDYKYEHIAYGIGIPKTAAKRRIQELLPLVDFVLQIAEEKVEIISSTELGFFSGDLGE